MKRRYGAVSIALVLSVLVAMLAAALIAGVANAILFDPAFTASVSDPGVGTNADVTTEFGIAKDHVNSAAQATFTPPQFTVATDAAVPNGAIVGTLAANATWGLLNGACNTTVAVSFDMMDATTDTSVTVTFDEQFQDANANNLPDGIDKYPDFLTRMFPGLTPRARQYGETFLAGMHLSANLVIFEPGVSLPGLGALGSALGYPSVSVLNVIRDPTAPPAPSPITDSCTPLSTESTTFGLSKDNSATPANEDGVTVRANPAAAGMYTFTSRAISNLDADDDNIENGLDTCPYAKNVGDPTVPGSGDQDNDGIDAACDPDPNGACGPGPGDELFVRDCDQDGYDNRGDNCPLMANGADPDNQKDADADGIGDACDISSQTPDGTPVDKTNTAGVQIGPATPTPPPATPTPPPVTPTPPLVTPTATPTATPEGFHAHYACRQKRTGELRDTGVDAAHQAPRCPGGWHLIQLLVKH